MRSARPLSVCPVGSVQFVFTVILIMVLARYCSDPLLLIYDSLFSPTSVQTIDIHHGQIGISAFQSLFSFPLWLFLSFLFLCNFLIFSPSLSSSILHFLLFISPTAGRDK
ncbi:hypothetical protein M441DRAFT_267880 [Trichoderma asperellum CBS 433.97]|uniref:Uncharacterized protein n=1 Tax=Trichoderma asperellum (strain ATCC 204424 / CBS 433.97 / NBRC 101777) TaxID=1042311 RepID=A0A2T3YVU3_TRIA4|nr:hypothetical protein M441DRAFT_267880 [Trichoderma asperellum CBS 433.97]PTB36691.1 hypothetical protein M441DRAFT_267880 [Trichoderma asperellum CBS 433.97]